MNNIAGVVVVDRGSTYYGHGYLVFYVQKITQCRRMHLVIAVCIKI